MSYHFTLLDGGMGRELERLGAPFRQPEWSAQSLIECPKKVMQVHEHFIAAGCDIITASCYAVIPYHIGQERFDQQGRELISLAVEMAQKAANKAPRKIRIAASLPPIFGSYRPSAFDVDNAISVATALIEEQADKTDLWLMETMGLIAEAQLYLSLLSDRANAIWVSFSLDDQADQPVLRSGEALQDAIEAMADQVDAILLNCSTIETMKKALPILQQHCKHIPYGIYANAFNPIQDDTPSNAALNKIRKDVTPFIYGETARHWLQQGASIIGGCCGIGPEHIAEIHKIRGQ